MPMERVEILQRELGRFEGRLELEEMTRLTLVAQLQREQERADQERDEQIAAQKKIERLQVELEEASPFVVA
jgi:hypothetical protein